MNPKTFLLSALLAPLLATAAHAALMVTYAESPSMYNSTLSGVSVFNFDTNLTRWKSATESGISNNVQWKDGTGGTHLVGTYDQLFVRGPDVNGGAVGPGFPNGSGYTVQSSTVGITTTTLSLNGDYAYFGFWWSAGDGSNVISFYDNGTQVAQFTTATLLNRIAGDTSYKGNPRTGLNNTESYAFINFFGLEGTKWDTIVFSNTVGSTTGFESDNHTVRQAAYNPTTDGPMPGIPLALITGTTVTAVPEPGISALALLSAGLLFLRRRRAA